MIDFFFLFFKFVFFLGKVCVFPCVVNGLALTEHPLVNQQSELTQLIG